VKQGKAGFSANEQQGNSYGEQGNKPFRAGEEAIVHHLIALGESRVLQRDSPIALY